MPRPRLVPLALVPLAPLAAGQTVTACVGLVDEESEGDRDSEPGCVPVDGNHVAFWSKATDTDGIALLVGP